MKTSAALLALCFWVNAVAQTASKCGVPQVWSPGLSSLRVVGGREATYGSHPWLVSFRFKGSHFCGGAILTDRWIMTAAHCFGSVSKKSLSGVTVAVGEFDRRVDDEEEQVFHINAVSVHEKYHPASPMSYDIALVKLHRPIKMGVHIQPICLPSPNDNVVPRTSCVVGGWGKVKERGRLPDVLREVQLRLLDAARCKYVLQTVQSSVLNRAMGRPEVAMTALCAGPEKGGRDACQGDSGGPLVCLTGSGTGSWVARGITSWGKGCGRSWENNMVRPPSRRGSPGVFTDVGLLLPWIKRKLRETNEQQRETSSSSLCSVSDGPVTDSEGIIRNPDLSGDRYDNNELCLWSISVPPGYNILLEFDRFDLENDSYCRYDQLTVSAGAHRPVGMFCGGAQPGPLLLNQSATIVFSSDIREAGLGFVIRYRAVQQHSEPGCGAVVLVEDQTFIRSPNYPQSYSNDCVLRWVVYAPPDHIVKLDVVDMHLEESDRCLYDSLTILGDVEQTDHIAVLCGGGVPPAVLSYHNVMVLRFSSDGSITHRGFRATLTFISHVDLHGEDSPGVQRPRDFLTGPQDVPDVQQFNSRAEEYQGETAQTPQNPRMHMDDEDCSEESSGTHQ